MIEAGTTNTQVGHFIDILPTCLDLAGVTYPEEFKGHKLTPVEGNSLAGLFKGKHYKGHEAIYWEHEGSRAIRKGKWKLVAEINTPWELYDMESDRTELNNLAAKYPAKVKELEKNYLTWANKVGVQDWNKIK